MRSIFNLAAFAALGSSLVATVTMSVPGLGQFSIAAEQPFLKENADAMSRMMIGMALKPTGDVDRDFTAMMIPHHQGAIDMAIAELKYGHNVQLRRIAQEIIVDQQQEIAAMRLALGQKQSASSPSRGGDTPGSLSSDDNHAGHPMEQAR